MAATTPPTTLDNLDTIVGIFGTLVTAFAVIVGAIWAYYKFVKGRTYKPRLEVDLEATWHEAGGRQLLRTRVTVKNIGASVVYLLHHHGTGLRVSVPDAFWSRTVAWRPVSTNNLLAEHDWIEPLEHASDDLLLDLEVPAPVPCMLEARLVWSASAPRSATSAPAPPKQTAPTSGQPQRPSEARKRRRGGNIQVFAREIFLPVAPPTGDHSDPDQDGGT